MSNAWQDGVVLVLVLLAAAYSVWYLLPDRFRKLLGVVHQGLARKPVCGACSSCGKCALPAPSARAAVQPITFHPRR